MSYILCIETSQDICSVVVARDGVTLESAVSVEPRAHGRVLTVLIDSVLTSSGIAVGDLEAVAVSAGPGSYTGLRIGVGVAKGLVYGAKCQLIAVSTLEIMAEGLSGHVPEADILVPSIDARRMGVFLGGFSSSGSTMIEPGYYDLPNSEIGKIVATGSKSAFGGSGAIKLIDIQGIKPYSLVEDELNHAKYMVGLASRRLNMGNFVDANSFEPHYLKHVHIGK